MINIARSQMANKRLLSEIALLVRIKVFEVGYYLSCRALSQFELLNFVTV